jgi:hypothetical protein
MGDSSVRSIRADIAGSVWKALQLGVYGEKWESLPGIAASGIVPGPAAYSLLTFGTARSLTSHMAADKQAGAKLGGLLTVAENALAQGDKTTAQKALSSYIDIVEKNAFIQPPPATHASLQTCAGCHQLGSNTIFAGLEAGGLSEAARILYPR